MLERTGVTAIVLRNDVNPFYVVDELELHGILFTGGGDISPTRYGGDENVTYQQVNPERDDFEFELMRLAFEIRIPVLGICRGMQLANVFLGGTLIEDIPRHAGLTRSITHHQGQVSGKGLGDYAHEITVMPNTLLHEMTASERIEVNSFHHQAIRLLGRGLNISGRSEDGIIEAVEYAKPESGFFVGVQWHPEQLTEDRTTQELYARLARACSAISM
jgi:putative glutamine amidotransferase